MRNSKIKLQLNSKLAMLILMIASALVLGCKASVTVPDVPVVPNTDTAVVNPTAPIEAKLSTTTTTAFNAFRIEGVAQNTFVVTYRLKPTSDLRIMYNSEAKQEEGCQPSQYATAIVWKTLNVNGTVMTTTPIRLGEAMNIKANEENRFEFQVSGVAACAWIRHSFILDVMN